MRHFDFLKPISLKNKVRLGRKEDGGYVVYEPVLKTTDVLITYGVGWEITFEEEFNKLTGQKVLMFDPTMFGKYLIDFGRLNKLLVNLRLIGVFFYLRGALNIWLKNIELKKKSILFLNQGLGVKPAFKCDTLRSHIQQFQLGNKSILLKIDIEGTEYDIFNDLETYADLKMVNQLLVEFHNLKNRLRELEIIVKRLKDVGFEIVHIHANNAGVSFMLYAQEADQEDLIIPDIVELTFVKKEFIIDQDIVTEHLRYPTLGLDFPNDLQKKDFTLNFGNQ